jgi:glycosyltransferase involved in cell wall biosynthesis
MSDVYWHLGGRAAISGIQRVLLCIAFHRRVSSEHEVLLGTFDPVHRQYVEFPLPDEQMSLERLRKHFDCRRVSRFPMKSKFASKPLRRFYYRLRTVINYFWQTRVRALILKLNPKTRPVSIQFREGDVFLMLGAGWDPNHREMWSHLKPEIERHNVEPIVLIHDLIPVVRPDDFRQSNHVEVFRYWLESICPLVGRFLVYSENTKRDLVDYLRKTGYDQDRIEIFRLAHELPATSERDTICEEVRKLAQAEYVLMVGPIEGRKNGNALVLAWSKLRDDLGLDHLPLLVIAGGGKPEQITVPVDDRLRRKIHFVYRPNDAEMAHLYQKSRFTVFPSKYEGWGLPIGESMWYGKFCVTSNISSIPEVAGDLVDYFDPNDPEDMAKTLQRPIGDPEYLAVREARIRNFELTTWAECARDLFGAVDRLLL